MSATVFCALFPTIPHYTDIPIPPGWEVIKAGSDTMKGDRVGRYFAGRVYWDSVESANVLSSGTHNLCIRKIP